jgi:hypothetical protein
MTPHQKATGVAPLAAAKKDHRLRQKQRTELNTLDNKMVAKIIIKFYNNFVLDCCTIIT